MIGATRGGNKETGLHLLAYGTDMNKKDASGEESLTLVEAARYGHEETASYLLYPMERRQ
jgi:hypothetical protein